MLHKVTVDDAVLARLDYRHAHVELCDASGQTVGFFVSPELHHKLIYGWARSAVTDEELDASRRRGGGRPLAEFWAELYKKEAERVVATNGTPNQPARPPPITPARYLRAMRYTVTWNDDALDCVTAFWTNAPDSAATTEGAIDREMIASATNQIDAILGSTPETAGESRSGRTRFMVVGPLAVHFEVLEDDRIVNVLSVQLLTRPE